MILFQHYEDIGDIIEAISQEWSDDSDFSEGELETIEKLITAVEETHLEVVATDDVNIHELLVEDNTITATYTEDEAVELVKGYIPPDSFTCQQKSLQSSGKKVLAKKQHLQQYINKQYTAIKNIHRSCVKQHAPSEQTKFMSSFHNYVYALTPCMPFEEEDKILLTKVLVGIRKAVVANMVVAAKNVPVQEVTISESGYGKIRYVGGYCVAKKRFHSMNKVRRALSVSLQKRQNKG